MLYRSHPRKGKNSISKGTWSLAWAITIIWHQILTAPSIRWAIKQARGALWVNSNKGIDLDWKLETLIEVAILHMLTLDGDHLHSPLKWIKIFHLKIQTLNYPQLWTKFYLRGHFQWDSLWTRTWWGLLTLMRYLRLSKECTMLRSKFSQLISWNHSKSQLWLKNTKKRN